MRSRPGHFVDLRLKQRVKQVPTGQVAAAGRPPSTPRGGSGEGLPPAGTAGLAFPRLSLKGALSIRPAQVREGTAASARTWLVSQGFRNTFRKV